MHREPFVCKGNLVKFAGRNIILTFAYKLLRNFFSIQTQTQTQVLNMNKTLLPFLASRQKDQFKISFVKISKRQITSKL